jgi:hypothetical protein
LAVLAFIGAGVAFLAPGAALAQTTRQSAVNLRQVPDFQSEGLDLGTVLSPILNPDTIQTLNSFQIHAGLKVMEEFDDNIFNTANDGIADKIFHIMPSIGLQSDWSRHAFSANFSVDKGYYEKNTAQNYYDYIIDAKARIDVQDESNLGLGYIHARQHQIGNAPLTAPSAFDPSNPFGPVVNTNNNGTVVYHQDIFALQPVFSTDPLIARINIDGQRWSYLTNNNVDLGYQNFWEYAITPRIGYQAWEDTSLYIEPQYSQRIYDANQDPNGFNQNSREYQVLFGLTYDFADITYLDVGIGVVHSTFADPAFSPTTGPTFDISGIWNATELLTLNARLLQSNLATTDFETKQVATNSFSLGADWEVRNNLYFNLTGTYVDSVYQSVSGTTTGFTTPENRHDRTFTYSVGLTYYFLDYLTANASYLFTDRKSNFEDDKLTKRQWFISVAAKI